VYKILQSVGARSEVDCDVLWRWWWWWW